jgi:cyclophilin family peptidyl-prolyl cis-trans isomerase
MRSISGKAAIICFHQQSDKGSPKLARRTIVAKSPASAKAREWTVFRLACTLDEEAFSVLWSTKRGGRAARRLPGVELHLGKYVVARISTSICPRFAGRLVTLLIGATVFGLPSSSRGAIVRFNTSMGNIDVRLYEAATPNSVENFLSYVTSNRYVGTFIHRVPQRPPAQGGGTSNFVVQGGGFLLNNSIFAATGIATDPPIGDEPGISNTRGTLAFAKNAQGATSQWFFNIGNNSFLDDQDFTVFGRVVGNGMSIVDSINNLPAVDASVAENANGEDFDEIPVRDLQRVLSQNDITNNEAVMINSVTLRNLPAGDYDFNGVVNDADYTVWKNQFGSIVDVAADGNGDGKVNSADYTIWRNTFGQSSGAGGDVTVVAPEPASAVLLLIAACCPLRIRRRRIVARRPH